MRAEPPAPTPWDVSDEEAVLLCRDWMIFLGATDTVAASGTQQSCDLYSHRYLGWVDNRRGNLDVDDVERAASIAGTDGRGALIFVSGGVIPRARQRADLLGVALLRYGAQGGDLDGANSLGRQLCASGLASA